MFNNTFFLYAAILLATSVSSDIGFKKSGQVLLGKATHSLGPDVTESWPDAKLVKGKTGAVATEHATCSDIGRDILKKGGSAVDAAISAALCVGSIDSFASGIGGGGFMVVRTGGGKSDFINFRETAPLAATQDMYKGHPEKSLDGPLAIAVPGELRGLELAHKKYGKLSWQELLNPIVKLNRNGFKVTRPLAEMIQLYAEYIKKDAPMKAVFMKNGNFLKEGDICKRPTYARTLELIAQKGVNALYDGELTGKVINEIRGIGGILSVEDLRRYKAVSTATLETTFRGKKIITTPPPTSGAILIAILNILEEMDLKESSVNGDFSAISYHRIIEAFRFAYAKRSRLGDPAKVDLRKILPDILSKTQAAAIRKNISDSQTFDPSYYNPSFDTVHSAGTTSLSVVAADGQAVSLMSTVNDDFGAKFMSESTGIIWNDQMDDFSTPGSVNLFGYPPSPNNYIVPGKRPLSSSVPTIVVDSKGQLEMTIGASGGSRIITSVAQVLLRCLTVNETLDYAIGAPRMHNQLFPNELRLEAKFNRNIANELAKKQHNITWMKPRESESQVQAIRVVNGVLHAVSDGRTYGSASAY